MIGAIVVAAGFSSRMGAFKQLLPYGSKTVIEHVVGVLRHSPVDEIIVVTGHRAKEVEAVLADAAENVSAVFNPHHASGEMLSSLQVGLQTLPAKAIAALLCMGDQPAIQVAVVQQLLDCFAAEGAGQIYIPSYDMRAGHPIVIPSQFWKEILSLPAKGEQSLRQVIRADTTPRRYLTVDTPSILRDMDTPEDYQRELRLRNQRLGR